MRKYLLSLFISVFTMCLGLAQYAHAQARVTGKIIDTITQEPLTGATIIVTRHPNCYFSRFGWNF